MRRRERRWGEGSGAQEAGFLRQLLMKVLRSAPVSPLALASALHCFILSCWELSLESEAAGALDRQVFMKDLRASPVRLCDVACALQSFIFCCCELAP